MRRLTQLVTLEHTLFATYIKSSILHNCPIQSICFILYFISKLIIAKLRMILWWKTSDQWKFILLPDFFIKYSWIAEYLNQIYIIYNHVMQSPHHCKKIKRDDNDKFPVFYWGLYTNNTKRSSFETSKLNANIKSIVNNKSMNENCIQNIFWMNKQKYLLHRFLRSNV